MFILYVYALSEPQDFFSFLFFKVHLFKIHCQGGSIIPGNVYLLITIFIIFIVDYKERTRILLFNILKHGGLFQ